MNIKNSKKLVLKAAVLTGVIFASNSVFADDKDKVAEYLDTCQMLPLVSEILLEKPNLDVCVDAPVSLDKIKVVFDVSNNTVDGDGRNAGIRHLMATAVALKYRVDAGLIDADDINVVGVFQGAGISLLHKNSITGMNKKLVSKIFQLKNAGININLEACGVSMHSKDVSNADLFVNPNIVGKIHVNQGAVGRIIDLQQNEFALIKE